MEPSTDVTGSPIRTDAPTERLQLDERSWAEVTRGWFADSERLYRILAEQVPWRQGRVFRYERYYDEPRLTAGLRFDGPVPDPVLPEIHRAVRAKYAKPFGWFGMAWYRDGRDSVAFHRDREMRWCEDTLVVLLVIGARRPFLLKPRSERDRDAPAPYDLAPGHGDLVAMGGACQVGWLHSVPKVPGLVGGRMSLQWRWTSRTGRPEKGPGYRAPRFFSR